jgi:hypothetical protein
MFFVRFGPGPPYIPTYHIGTFVRVRIPTPSPGSKADGKRARSIVSDQVWSPIGYLNRKGEGSAHVTATAPLVVGFAADLAPLIPKVLCPMAKE